jgi:hypothetical protein
VQEGQSQPALFVPRDQGDAPSSAAGWMRSGELPFSV